jgi:acyl carrier protein
MEDIDQKVIEIVSEQMGVDKSEITARRTSSTT